MGKKPHVLNWLDWWGLYELWWGYNTLRVRILYFFGVAGKTADRQSGRSREDPFPLPHKGKKEKGPLDCKINLLIELLDYIIVTSSFGLWNVTKSDSLNVEVHRFELSCLWTRFAKEDTRLGTQHWAFLCTRWNADRKQLYGSEVGRRWSLFVWIQIYLQVRYHNCHVLTHQEGTLNLRFRDLVNLKATIRNFTAKRAKIRLGL